MDTIDIEELRAWLKGFGSGEYRNIAKSSGVPYQSLCNFVYGRVEAPHWRNLHALLKYRQQCEAA